MITVDWKGGRAFEATPPSGKSIVFDAYPESGGKDRGPTPLEAFVASLAACTGMDVLSILEKKKQVVNRYSIEIEGERTREGIYPRPYTSFAIRHVIEGDDVDPEAVERAIQLSEEKYCSVAATLRSGPEIKATYEIREAALAR